MNFAAELEVDLPALHNGSENSREKPMKNEVRDELASVRDSWSEEERQKRRKLACVMQLQIRSLVVLSDLSQPGNARETSELDVASAC